MLNSKIIPIFFILTLTLLPCDDSGNTRVETSLDQYLKMVPQVGIEVVNCEYGCDIYDKKNTPPIKRIDRNEPIISVPEGGTGKIVSVNVYPGSSQPQLFDAIKICTDDDMPLEGIYNNSQKIDSPIENNCSIIYAKPLSGNNSYTLDIYISKILRNSKIHFYGQNLVNNKFIETSWNGSINVNYLSSQVGNYKIYDYSSNKNLTTVLKNESVKFYKKSGINLNYGNVQININNNLSQNGLCVIAGADNIFEGFEKDIYEYMKSTQTDNGLQITCDKLLWAVPIVKKDGTWYIESSFKPSNTHLASMLFLNKSTENNDGSVNVNFKIPDINKNTYLIYNLNNQFQFDKLDFSIIHSTKSGDIAIPLNNDINTDQAYLGFTLVSENSGQIIPGFSNHFVIDRATNIQTNNFSYVASSYWNGVTFKDVDNQNSTQLLSYANATENSSYKSLAYYNFVHESLHMALPNNTHYIDYNLNTYPRWINIFSGNTTSAFSNINQYIFRKEQWDELRNTDGYFLGR